MWDKNRPTRMIPRAEVYTSTDLTVEELREGEELTLTAEALADRIGEALPRDDESYPPGLAQAGVAEVVRRTPNHVNDLKKGVDMPT